MWNGWNLFKMYEEMTTRIVVCKRRKRKKKKSIMEEVLDIYLICPLKMKWVEFKQAKGKQYDKDKLGQYFSALSNEANLKVKIKHGWYLVVKMTKRLVQIFRTLRLMNIRQKWCSILPKM
jgi:hypothetical protein